MSQIAPEDVTKEGLDERLNVALTRSMRVQLQQIAVLWHTQESTVVRQAIAELADRVLHAQAPR